MSHPLRRDDLEIHDPIRIEEILSRAKYATLALTDREQPYAVTLSCGYDFERSRLCFHVAREGRKLDIIARNPRACATVVVDNGYLKGECAHPYESVVMFGWCRLLTEPEDVRAGMRTLIGQLETAEDTERIWAKHRLDTLEALERFSLLSFEIESLTAKTGR